MRRRNPVLPSPGQFKKQDLFLRPSLFLNRETAQGQGLPGAGTPQGEFLWGFIFCRFFLHAGAAEGWGVYSPAPSHCTVSLPLRQRGLPNPTPIFGDFCVRILILKIKFKKSS